MNEAPQLSAFERHFAELQNDFGDHEDPFVTQPPEVLDCILTHLTSREVIETSLVAPSWFNHIKDSRVCMSKISVILDGKKDKDVIQQTIDLAASPMKYEHLEIYNCYCEKNSAEILNHIMLLKDRKWKSVKIWLTNFQNAGQAFDFLEGFEDCVENLEMQRVEFVCPDDDPKERDFKFARLKKLYTNHIDTKFYDVFRDVKSVRQLTIRKMDAQFTKAFNPIVKMLQQNIDLKLLNVHGKSFELVFESDIAKTFKFKLCDIRVGSNDLGEKQLKIEKNFTEFLKSQKQGLSQVTIENWMGLQILNEVFDLPNLMSLQFSGPGLNVELSLDWKKLRFKRNPKLKSCKITELPRNEDTLTAFFSALSHFNVLVLTKVTQLNLKVLSKVMTDLRHLKCSTFDATDLSDEKLLPKLETLTIGYDSPEIDMETQTIKENRFKLSMLAKPEDQRNRLEKMYCASIQEAISMEY